MPNTSKRTHATERVADFSTIAVALAAVLFAGSVAWSTLFGASRPGAKPEDREVREWESLIQGGHKIGAEKSSFTLLEFIDYECAACRAFHHRSLAGVRATFPGELSVIVRHFPLPTHPNAYFGARLAECGAEQGRFQEVHNLLLGAISLENLDLEQLARQAELPDVPGFLSCASSKEVVPAIEADIEAGNRLGVRGTPSLILEGILLGVTPDSAELATLVSGRLRNLGKNRARKDQRR